MKALTIQQPWAWAVAAGIKDVENRTQLWQHRGLVAIHAGARRSDRGEDDPRILAAVRRAQLPISPHKPLGLPTRWTGDLQRVWPLGAVIGVATIAGAHYEDDCGGTCSPWAESITDPWNRGRKDNAIVHLQLTDAHQLHYPVRVRGQLSLWTLDREHTNDVERQLR